MDATTIQPYEHYQRLVRQLAYKVRRRLHAAGARTMQVEDIMQEIAMTWCQARDKYDPQKGVPFVSYFVSAVWFNVNRWAQDHIDEALMAPVSLDAQSLESEDDGPTLSTVIADPSPLIDEILIDKERRQNVMRQLSAPARSFLELLADPTPEIYRELDAIRERAEYARSRGLSACAPSQVAGAMIFNLLGFNRLERRAVYKELEAVAALVNQK